MKLRDDHEVDVVLSHIMTAKGPNREVDRLIHLLLLGHEASNPISLASVINRFLSRNVQFPNVPAYTGNMAVLIAFIRQHMPEWAYYAQHISVNRTKSSAQLWLPAQRTQGHQHESFHMEAETVELALCGAIIRTLRAMATW